MREANWERNFRSAARYARKYKHLLVPASYVDSDGVRLGVWVSNLRAARKNRPDSYQVTPAHIKKLNSIGMVWDARDAKWGTAYQQAKAYYKAHGNLHAAANYKSDETGFCLGDWLRRMREWMPPTTPSSPLSAAQCWIRSGWSGANKRKKPPVFAGGFSDADYS